jgi:hypothetical protein
MCVCCNQQVEGLHYIFECVETFRDLGYHNYYILDARHVELYHLRYWFKRILSLPLISDYTVIDLIGHLLCHFEACFAV